MADTQSYRDGSPRHTVAMTAAGALCLAGGVATFVAVVSLFGLCQNPTFERCDGLPSFELVFQVVLAAAGFAGTFVVRLLVKRRSYATAGGMLVVVLLVFASWALFLDAATHGWDDLKLVWLGE